MSWLVAAANTPGDCISGIFHQFWPQTVNGITQGSIIAMVALGYTMVYGVLQLINFAHSEVFMIGTVITLYAFRNWFGVVNPIGGFGQIAVIVGSMIPAMFFCALTAVVLERVAYRPLRKRGAPRLAPRSRCSICSTSPTGSTTSARSRSRRSSARAPSPFRPSWPRSPPSSSSRGG